MQPTIAYLAQGKLYVRKPDGEPELVESQFAQELLDRSERSRQRNEWKSQGDGIGQMLPGRALWNQRAENPALRQVRISALSPSSERGKLIYSLATSTVGGLFVYDISDRDERRIFHRNQFEALGLSTHPKQERLVLSVSHPDGTASIAVMDTQGRGLREITEGDVVDELPTWAPGANGDTIVYQSAGIGRNSNGMRVALGPYAIHKLRLDDGEFETLLEDEQIDYLAPRMTDDGSLYYIERPYEGRAKVPMRNVFMDTLLFPFRVLGSIVHFLSFFAQMFSGKPLFTAGDARVQGPDTRTMMLWGKMIDAEQAMAKAKGADTPPLVPKSWKLKRRSASGTEETLAEGVLSFDITTDGQVVTTDGSSVFVRDPSGESRKACIGKLISQVVAAQ
jgi:hypothetical protein